MIITSRTEKFYKIEMTAEQAHYLQVLLETGRGKHVNEMHVQEEHGSEVADGVRETVTDMLDALEER